MPSEDGEYYNSALSDDEDHTKKPARGKKSTNYSGYRIANVLKVPRATTYTAQALYDQIHSSDIDLEPEYQRAVVWPEVKQIGIIDSVFRNFYIPPVIFCVNVHDDGSETKTCIDGKQRLTSIHRTNGRFMDGLIPHKDPLTNEKYWYKDAGAAVRGTRTRKILPEKYRRLFANKQIVCVEYQDITDGDEREIFQRVQLGMALTPAEKIQVISSPRASLVRELQTTYLQDSSGLIGCDFEWDHSRGVDFRCLAQTILAIEKYPSPQSVTLAPLERWLAQPNVVIDKPFRDRIHKVYRTMLGLVRDEELKKAFQSPSKVAPIEFVFIGLLITTHMDHMSPPQLSSAIRKMRDEVRNQHVDIRLNDRVARTMLEFVRKLETGRMSVVSSERSTPAETTGSLKRKREEKAESRKMVKSEATDGTIPWAITGRLVPPPTGMQRSNVASTSIRNTPMVPPPSLDRLAARQAQAGPSSLTIPGSTWQNRGTPASQRPIVPHVQTYGSLQESITASLGRTENSTWTQDGWGGHGTK